MHMSYYQEERLKRLEKLVEKQSFHIFLLQHLAMDNAKYGLYYDIISTDMSEQTFNMLRELTKQYEDELSRKGSVSMSDFVHQFSKILMVDSPWLIGDMSSFIPHWLGGVNDGFGFSKKLYDYFY